MHPDPIIDGICKELVSAHRVHTILLYGSRADGAAGDDSDYDIAAFGAIDAPFRIARLEGGAYLDVWVYPEAALLNPGEEDLRLRGSQLLLQRADEAEAFLGKIEALFRRGPAPLSDNEIAARQVWAHKMLARMARGDVEGHYRRVWLLQLMLENYFQLRGLWFQGPKKALAWLAAFDPPAYRAFSRALQPGADDLAVAALVHLIAGPRQA